MEKSKEEQLVTGEELHPRDELDRVEAWRQEELERAGYGVTAARELSLRHDVDLHGAVLLLTRGCPQELALRILL